MQNTIVACAETFTLAARKELDARIRDALRSNGLPTQKQVFNHASGKKFGLYQASVTEVFAIFFVGIPVLEVMFKRESPVSALNHPLFLLYKSLNQLANLTYFWPLKGVDTPSQVERLHGVDKSEYHRQLLSLAKQHFGHINYCAKNGFDFRSGEEKSAIDRLTCTAY